jgi:hypothetical protein
MLGGDPSSAVKVLQLRLQIPNQTAVVQQLLEQAERAAGQVPESATESTTTSTTSSTPTTSTSPASPGDPGPGKSDGHGQGFRHGGPTGGAGLAPPPRHGHGPSVHGNLAD